jgi:hypothetical protein
VNTRSRWRRESCDYQFVVGRRNSKEGEKSGHRCLAAGVLAAARGGVAGPATGKATTVAEKASPAATGGARLPSSLPWMQRDEEEEVDELKVHLDLLWVLVDE